MEKEYLNDLEKVYKDRMTEVNENIEAQVRADFKVELKQTTSANSQSTFWNQLKGRYTNYRQAERDNNNTQNANQERLDAIEERIQAEIDLRSKEQSKLMEADIFEDFGGSREAALKQKAAYEEEQKEKVKGEAKEQFNAASGEKQRKLDAEKGKAQWGFDVTSGRQEQKQEAIQGKAQEAFQEASKVEDENNEQVVEEQENQAEKTKREEATVEVKAPEKEQEAKTLDTAYWKRAEQVEVQHKDASDQITVSKESSCDAEMAARITKSFDRSNGEERSCSY